jgi:hypothetical protein
MRTIQDRRLMPISCPDDDRRLSMGAAIMTAAKEPKAIEDRVRTLENTRAAVIVVGMIALGLLGIGTVSTYNLASTLGELKQLSVHHTKDIDRILDRLEAKRVEAPGSSPQYTTAYLPLPCHVIKLSGDELLTKCYGEYEDKHKLAADARVFINGKIAKVQDLKEDMAVRMLTDEKGMVVVLEGTTPPPPPETVKPPRPEK